MTANPRQQSAADKIRQDREMDAVLSRALDELDDSEHGGPRPTPEATKKEVEAAIKKAVAAMHSTATLPIIEQPEPAPSAAQAQEFVNYIRNSPAAQTILALAIGVALERYVLPIITSRGFHRNCNVLRRTPVSLQRRGIVFSLPAHMAYSQFGYRLSAARISFAASVMAPLVEETVYRLGYQEVMLRRIPKAVAARFAPGHEALVDSIGARLTRVVVVAYLFALAHLSNRPVDQLMPTFVGGIVMGLSQEFAENTTFPMLVHAAYNTAVHVDQGRLR
jgi:membrane protease YdiL (CAAX protease family)